MRKITSLKEEESKKKQSVLIISIFLLLVLVLGTAGYALLSGTSGSSQSQNSGNIKQVGDQWEVIVGNQVFYLQNSPDVLENVSVSSFKTIQDYSSEPLYIDSANDAMSFEISSTLGRYASRVQKACYGECQEDLPVKDCTSNLVIWRDSPENQVYEQENCIFIEGDLRAVDAFIYKTFGVTK